ncbi:MAG: DUF1416 domain-containing protein [Methanomassiliicoccales archaeon]|nr:MAG: DUF1416 domain-containing protein [Methanomassiliicoccales archaeon]
MKLDKSLEVAILVSIIATVSFSSLVTIPEQVSAYIPHDPISINGNADFTPANGVTGGSGTPSDPYIIEGWDIEGRIGPFYCIRIYNTDAPFILRNVYAHFVDIDFGCVSISNVSNAVIENTEIVSPGWGLGIGDSHNITIKNSTVSGAWIHDVDIAYSTNITIVNSRIGPNRLGSLISWGCSNVTIKDNIFPGGRVGIELYDETNVEITGNTIASNDGIHLINVSHSNVTGNSVTAWVKNVHLEDSSNITLSENTIIGRHNFTYGAHLENSSSIFLNHNNFMNNTYQALDDLGSENSWDDGYPSGGNYWSNYTGVDQKSGPNQDQPGSDGIGDTPFIIDTNSQDNYPLMTPIGSLAPLIWIKTPTEGEILTTTPTQVYGYAQDRSGKNLERAEVRVNAGPWTDANFFVVWDWTISIDLIPGPNLVEARVWDNTGNSSAIASVNVTYLVSGIVRGRVMSSGGNPIQDAIVRLVEMNDTFQYEDVTNSTGEFQFPDVIPGTYNVTASAPCHLPTVVENVVVSSGIVVDLGDLVLTADNCAPIASFTLTPGAGNITTVFDVDASDSSDFEDPVTALEVRWDWEDDGIWDTAYSTTKSAQHQYPTPADYTIRLEVRDTGGLTNQTTKLVYVRNVPPVARFDITPPTGDTSTTFEVNASASSDLEDPTTALEVRWDWEDDGIWDTAWSMTKTAQHQYANPATYTIRLQIRDTAGLMNFTTRQVVVGHAGNEIPTCTIVTPISGETVSGSYRVSGIATDSDGAIEKVEIRIDWGSWIQATGTTSWVYDWDTTSTWDGPHTIEARSYDGLDLSPIVSVTATVDNAPVPNQPPVCAITAPTLGETVSGTYIIAGTASDPDGNVDKVEVRIDSGGWLVATGTTSWSYDWDTTALSDGQHVIYARSFDGTDYSSEELVIAIVDNTPPPPNEPPTCTMDTPIDGETVSGIYTIAGSASDPDGTIELVEIRIDDVGWVQASGTTSWSYDWNTTVFSDGSHTVYARSYDGTDYSTAVNATVTVDNAPPPQPEPPVCSISSPTPGQMVSGTVEISGTSSDPDGTVQKVEIRIDSGTWIEASGTTTWSYDWNTTNVSDGQHTIYARSYDGALYSTEVNVTVSVDNVAPPEPGGPEGDLHWAWGVSAIVILAIVFASIYILAKRQKEEEGEPPEEPL